MYALRLALVGVVAASAWAQTAGQALSPDDQSKARSVLERFEQSPLTMEPNRGQAPEGIDFVAVGPYHRFLLASDETTLELFDPHSKNSDKVRLKFLGANRSSAGEALDQAVL